jgi:hypothetical protein
MTHQKTPRQQAVLRELTAVSAYPTMQRRGLDGWVNPFQVRYFRDTEDREHIVNGLTLDGARSTLRTLADRGLIERRRAGYTEYKPLTKGDECAATEQPNGKQRSSASSDTA